MVIVWLQVWMTRAAPLVGRDRDISRQRYAEIKKSPFHLSLRAIA
jgi:hypothetical protein